MTVQRSAALTALAVGLLALLVRLPFVAESLFHDEAVTLLRYVDGPWSAPWTGVDENDHLLFSVLARATRALLGDAPAVLRLWSVLPAAAAAAVLAHHGTRRGGPVTGLVAGGMLAAVPFVVDVTAAGRGYGLVVLGAALVVVGHPTTDDRPDRPWIAGLGLFLAAAAWPVAALPLAAAWLVLAVTSRPGIAGARRAMLAAVVATTLWWLPVLDDYLRALLDLSTRVRQDLGLETLPVLANPGLVVRRGLVSELVETLVGVELSEGPATALLVVGGAVAVVLVRRAWLVDRRTVLAAAAATTSLGLTMVLGGLADEIRFTLAAAPLVATMFAVGLAVGREARPLAVALTAAVVVVVGAGAALRAQTPREDYSGVARLLAEQGVEEVYVSFHRRAAGHVADSSEGADGSGPAVRVVVPDGTRSLVDVPADDLATFAVTPETARQRVCSGRRTVAIITRSDDPTLRDDGPCEQGPDEVVVVQTRYRPAFVVLVHERDTRG